MAERFLIYTHLNLTDYQETEIDEVLERINAVTYNHRLLYQLESISEDKLSARVAILLVAPDNNINYHVAKIANDTDWLKELVDEEVLVILYQEEGKWKAEYKSRKRRPTLDYDFMQNFVKPKIDQALKPTDWANTHRMLPDKLKNGQPITEKHKNTVKRWNAGQGGLQIAENPI